MSALWMPAYIGIGSNLDEPQMQVQLAFTALQNLQDTVFVARSRCYVTQPLGPQDQPDFTNAAAGLLTTLSVRALLGCLQKIETALGKTAPVQRWGARRIDLDLLVFGDLQLVEPELQVPHPGVSSRNFVLYPLLDIAPDLLVPGQGRVRDLAQRVRADGIVPFAPLA